MYIDYRMLNINTKLGRFPIPSIDDLLDRLSKATIISRIDLTNAYHQVSIKERHQFKTDFQTSFGLYECVVLPLGLCNAHATFQRLMHNVFYDALDLFITVYLNDILIFSENDA